MTRIPALVMAAVLLAAGTAPQAPAQEKQEMGTCPASGTLDELVKALDDAVSGAPAKDRTCLRELLLPDARLIPVSKGQTTGFAPHLLSVDEWIEAVKKRGGAPFYERQVKVKTEQYGHIAHLWSTYEVRPTPDGKATVRGINSIQAVSDGTRWRIVEILWQAETSGEAVPANDLP